MALYEATNTEVELIDGVELALKAQKAGKQIYDEGLFGELHPVELKKDIEEAKKLLSTHDYVFRYLQDDNTWTSWGIAPRRGFYLAEVTG